MSLDGHNFTSPRIETQQVYHPQPRFPNMSFAKIHHDPTDTVPMLDMSKMSPAGSGHAQLTSVLRRQPEPLSERQLERLLDQGFTRGE
jgi:hypothetical protein